MTSEFCPKCGAVRSGAFRFCRSCQFDFDAADTAPKATAGSPQPAPAAASASVAKKRSRPAAKIWGWLFVIGAGLWIYGTLNSHAAAPAAPVGPVTPAVAAWQPAGYTLAPDDPSIAFRWMASAEVKCTYSDGSCWGMEAIARDGCPVSLYVELSVEDASGAAVGFTNDLLGSVGPGQHAKLVFDTLTAGARNAHLAQVICN